MHLERLSEDMKHGQHGHTHYCGMVRGPRLEK
jgi:hypothetical protein